PGGGGPDPCMSQLQDTWEWDGARWVDRTATIAPAPRAFAAMAFDPVRRKVVLFGGCGSSMCMGGGLADTWEWDGARWTQLAPATSPPARMAHAMAYDGARHQLVMFGGCNGVADECFQERQDTWTFDGTIWTEQTAAPAPPGRGGHAMTFDPTRGAVVMFGGRSVMTTRSDTWEWNGAQWSERTPAVSPPPRVGHAMVFDPV